MGLLTSREDSSPCIFIKEKSIYNTPSEPLQRKPNTGEGWHLYLIWAATFNLLDESGHSGVFTPTAPVSVKGVLLAESNNPSCQKKATPQDFGTRLI
jgi:hypothetical protein